MAMQTLFEFSLPRGYLDSDGQVHRQGSMRLATAGDEIHSLQHPQVLANESFLPVILLSRVITQLGELRNITPQIIEGLFASDLAYLEDLYMRLNGYASVTLGATCPHCQRLFQLQVAPIDSILEA
jgi:hypothetical protein